MFCASGEFLAKNIAYGMRILFYDERRETGDVMLS
jgi:hypothetical protein